MNIFSKDEKRCPMCGRWLPPNWFGFSRLSKDNLQSYCKSCQKIYKMQHPTKQYKRKKDQK